MAPDVESLSSTLQDLQSSAQSIDHYVDTLRSLQDTARTVQAGIEQQQAALLALEKDRAELEEERINIERQREHLQAISQRLRGGLQQNIRASVTINVGGKRFTASRRTFSQFPESLFSSLGGETWPAGPNGEFYIDRNPRAFELILGYLRSPSHFSILPAAAALGISAEELLGEVDFFMLSSMKEKIQRELRESPETEMLRVVRKEQDKLEKERRDIALQREHIRAISCRLQGGFYQNQRNSVSLNVGGQRFTTTLRTLTRFQGSLFDCLGGDTWPASSEGEFFIDRSPRAFELILGYLRAPSRYCLLSSGAALGVSVEELLAEADFFLLPQLRSKIEEEIAESPETELERKRRHLHSLTTRLHGGFYQQVNNAVKLNVGGELFTTTTKTLTRYPETLFSALGGDLWPQNGNGEFFIDRNPKIFQIVLEFLRTSGSFSVLGAAKAAGIDTSQLLAEADFFMLPALAERVRQEQEQESKNRVGLSTASTREISKSHHKERVTSPRREAPVALKTADQSLNAAVSESVDLFFKLLFPRGCVTDQKAMTETDKADSVHQVQARGMRDVEGKKDGEETDLQSTINGAASQLPLGNQEIEEVKRSVDVFMKELFSQRYPERFSASPKEPSPAFQAQASYDQSTMYPGVQASLGYRMKADTEEDRKTADKSNSLEVEREVVSADGRMHLQELQRERDGTVLHHLRGVISARYMYEGVALSLGWTSKEGDCSSNKENAEDPGQENIPPSPTIETDDVVIGIVCGTMSAYGYSVADGPSDALSSSQPIAMVRRSIRIIDEEAEEKREEAAEALPQEAGQKRKGCGALLFCGSVSSRYMYPGVAFSLGFSSITPSARDRKERKAQDEKALRAEEELGKELPMEQGRGISLSGGEIATASASMYPGVRAALGFNYPPPSDSGACPFRPSLSLLSPSGQLLAASEETMYPGVANALGFSYSFRSSCASADASSSSPFDSISSPSFSPGMESASSLCKVSPPSTSASAVDDPLSSMYISILTKALGLGDKATLILAHDGPSLSSISQPISLPLQTSPPSNLSANLEEECESLAREQASMYPGVFKSLRYRARATNKERRVHQEKEDISSSPSSTKSMYPRVFRALGFQLRAAPEEDEQDRERRYTDNSLEASTEEPEMEAAVIEEAHSEKQKRGEVLGSKEPLAGKEEMRAAPAGGEKAGNCMAMYPGVFKALGFFAGAEFEKRENHAAPTSVRSSLPMYPSVYEALGYKRPRSGEKVEERQKERQNACSPSHPLVSSLPMYAGVEQALGFSIPLFPPSQTDKSSTPARPMYPRQEKPLSSPSALSSRPSIAGEEKEGPTTPLCRSMYLGVEDALGYSIPLFKKEREEAKKIDALAGTATWLSRPVYEGVEKALGFVCPLYGYALLPAKGQRKEGETRGVLPAMVPPSSSSHFSHQLISQGAEEEHILEGSDADYERERKTRTSLSLPGKQEDVSAQTAIGSLTVKTPPPRPLSSPMPALYMYKGVSSSLGFKPAAEEEIDGGEGESLPPLSPLSGGRRPHLSSEDMTHTFQVETWYDMDDISLSLEESSSTLPDDISPTLTTIKERESEEGTEEGEKEERKSKENSFTVSEEEEDDDDDEQREQTEKDRWVDARESWRALRRPSKDYLSPEETDEEIEAGVEEEEEGEASSTEFFLDTGIISTRALRL